MQHYLYIGGRRWPLNAYLYGNVISDITLIPHTKDYEPAFDVDLNILRWIPEAQKRKDPEEDNDGSKPRV